MKGDPEVISALQAMLAAEAHANIWYRNMWRVVKHMGVKASAHDLKSLGTRMHRFMKILKDRLLDFKADVTYEVGEISDESTLTATFKTAQAMEDDLSDMGQAAIELAVAKNDETTAEKLRHITERHQEDVVWLDEQLTLIAGMGEPLYVSEKLKK